MERATATIGSRVRAFHDAHPGLTWLIVFGLPIAVVVAGVFVAPEMFWDRFVWQDIYGPLWADAHQCTRTTSCHVEPPNEVPAKEGYTLTSELTYGLILALALYAIYTDLFVRLGVRANGWYVAALAPYILLGPTARTLEDANAFIGANGLPSFVTYLFISPVIYIHIAVYAVAFTLLGVLLHRAREAGAPDKLITGTIGAVLVAEVAAYAVLATGFGSTFGAVAPVWFVALAAVLGLAFFHSRVRAATAGVNATLFALGLPLVATPVYLIVSWISGNVWSTAAWNGQIYGMAGAIILLLALTVVLAVGLTALGLGRVLRGERGQFALTYATGFNLALVFGHMLDGFATWVALMDPFHLGLPSYGEKHPVSDMLLQLGAGTPFHGLGFPVAKLLMILIVIGLLDREAKRATPQEQNLLGLIKLAIFVLGFAPGTRDILRVVMGV